MKGSTNKIIIIKLLIIKFYILLINSILFGQSIIRYWRNDNSFFSNYVYDILKISNDKLIVITSEGIAIFEKRNQQFTHRSISINEIVYANIELTKAEYFRNYLWLGTRGRGIYRNIDDQKWELAEQLNNYLSDKFINTLLVWNNKLAIGTRSGLFIFDGTNVQSIIIPDSSFPIQVNSLATYNDDLYVATNQGLYKINPYNRINKVSLGIIPEPNIDCVYSAKFSKSIIIAGEFGVIRLSENENKFHLLPNKFHTTRFKCLYETETGYIYCGTAKGLIVIDRLNNVINVDFMNNLSINVPIVDIENVSNQLWMATLGMGLIVVNDFSVPVISSQNQAHTSSPNPQVSPIFNLQYFVPPNYSQIARNLPVNRNIEISNSNQRNLNLEMNVSSNLSQDQSRPAWTRAKKERKMDLSFYKDIYPVIIKECMDCHTNGSGKYFPLNNPEVLLTYFRKVKLDRFLSFCEEGGGMFGKVKPETINMLQMWVMTGCKE